MDLFDELELLDSPATDTATGERVPRGSRCPDCGTTGYGPAGTSRNVVTVRTDQGYVITSHCGCGRILWHDVDDRPGWDESVPPYPDGTPGHGSPLVPYTATPPQRSTARTVWRTPPQQAASAAENNDPVAGPENDTDLRRPPAAGSRRGPGM
ncbi:hypothetical protein ACFT1B_34320 [Streptomyces griseoincarnatus]|uniref:hypothetical protein n=1 Tax=Promicromonospora sp. NPDC057138 TaxID=3346031 RepID=UPI00363FFEF6